MPKSSGLGRRFLDNADSEVRSAMRSRSAQLTCDRIMCARVLLKLALEEYKKELSDVDTHPSTET